MTTPLERAPQATTAVAAAPRRVFVVDDDDVMLLSCRRILEKAGYEVETFGNGLDGIRRIEAVRPQLLLVDLKMPEIDGLQVIERVRAIDPDVVIAVITGYATISTAVDAMKAGAYDFLPKPFTPDELRLIVNRGCERWRLAMESAELRRQKEEAERRFVTFVSHQLKSPLVAAKQYLDVILFTSSAELPERTIEWLKRAQVRLGEMVELIEDWLALARIERGSAGDPAASTTIGDVLAKVVDAQAAGAQAAGVTIETEVAAGLGPVRGDHLNLATVVTNLLQNAVKYNRPGGRVRVSVRPEGGKVVLRVADTGIGIPADSLPRVFEEFYRVRTDSTREIAGTGLGLAICRRIVTDLGGSIGVESTEGEGTTVVVRVPLAAAAGRE